ncbi:MAG: hypothetical protein IKE28_10050 [Solobacterium sp.]|nr:hypothetical protein [Solobacterium sp.]
MPVTSESMTTSRRRIASVSCMHALIDFLCAFSMFGIFHQGNNLFVSFWTYNFCAFALQLPIGILADHFVAESTQARQKIPFLLVSAGILLTVAGCFTNPVILGLGNALFHTGGGIVSIQEDDHAGMKGAGLGVFVAPGAVGLFLGGVITDASRAVVAGGAFLILAALWFVLWNEVRNDPAGSQQEVRLPSDKYAWIVFAGCFAVVVLRSAIGLSVPFAWKTGFWPSFAAVAALALGKTAGGFLSARYGARKTMIVSLLTAAVCYGFKDIPLFGILALFTFNMTMPVTLYTLAKRFGGMPGFAFGALTFALFLGYAFVTGHRNPVPLFGTVGSIVSLLVLWPLVKDYE